MVVVGEKNYKHIDEGPIRRVNFARRSPTGNVDDSSASEDDDNGMRVGPEYQAVIPDYNPAVKPEGKHEAMLVWAPSSDPHFDNKIDDYITEAKERHNYNAEQALGMLFWHKHNIEKALGDLPNFTPFPDEWSVEDRVLFEQAFSFHGKSFHRIRMMLPDKTVGCLVKCYYSWKKTRSRTSLIDRQAHKVTSCREVSDDEMEGRGSSESEAEISKENNMKEETKNGIGKAGFGSRKILHDPRMRNKRKPPRGMYLNQDSLMTIATGPSNQGDIIIKQLETDLVNLKRQVQSNKQILSGLKDKTQGGLGSLRIQEGPPKANGRWSNEELLLAVQGVRKYGKDFKAISEVIGNKSETLVRSFFVNYRRRYNLDEVFAEYEKEHGRQVAKDSDKEEVSMEVDNSAVTGDIVLPVIATIQASIVESSEPLPLVTPPAIPTVSSPPPIKPIKENEAEVALTIDC